MGNVEGEFGPSDTLSTVLAKESFASAAGGDAGSLQTGRPQVDSPR